MHMTVRRVKQDFNDKSVTIPTSIIVVMNADFNNYYVDFECLLNYHYLHNLVSFGIVYAVMHTGNFVNA